MLLPYSTEPYVLFEDNHILALEKPAGMPSQDDESKDISILEWAKRYIKQKYQKKGNVYLALLHRIDRPVGGVLLLAKTSKAAARLSRQFQSGEIEKEYVAITEKIPSRQEGILVHYLRKISNKNIVRAYKTKVAHSHEAKLYYKIEEIIGNRAILKIRPYTGRQHQIRVQLASIGCTICGDVKYGKTSFLEDFSICLLSRRISFTHPITQEKITIESKISYSDMLKKIIKKGPCSSL